MSGAALPAPAPGSPRDALAAQLVHLHHLAEGDEADEGVGGEEGEGHLQGLLKGLQLVLVHAGVHHHQEDRRHHLHDSLATGKRPNKSDK